MSEETELKIRNIIANIYNEQYPDEADCKAEEFDAFQYCGTYNKCIVVYASFSVTIAVAGRIVPIGNVNFLMRPMIGIGIEFFVFKF